MPLARSSLPQTPPVGVPPEVHTITQDDLNTLEKLTAPDDTASSTRPTAKFQRREAPLDPLLYTAAVASGPHVTRHHYHHHHALLPFLGLDQNSSVSASATHPLYVSQQKPRLERLKEAGSPGPQGPIVPESDNTPDSRKPVKRPVLLPRDSTAFAEQLRMATALQPPSVASQTLSQTKPLQPLVSDNLVVQCRARTRIPTPHGPVFLHLYHNNRDSKEHLAIVVDPAQLEESDSSADPSLFIRSRSLDSQWRVGETDLERIVRGAYIGRLGSYSGIPSTPAESEQQSTPTRSDDIPPPLIRIHSECFTGETIGSMRCDCGEQLDEGIRRISEPQIITSTLPDGTSQSRTIPGRGAVIYLRQEGRGIGLLEKIRAYNVQDLGFDTVSANLILGHGADERGYEIAAAILRDLGLGSGDESEGVRLLTNNPDKVSALQHEGVRIVDRLEMVPRTWICGHENVGPDGQSQHSEEQHYLRRNGATLIGGGVTHGVELERYLRTKVERMGHMLNLPPTPSTPTYSSSASRAISPSRTSRSEELEDADDASSVPSLEADEGSSAAPTRPASATRELVEA